MTKIKIGIVAVVMLVSNLVFAQSLDDARKLINYQRYATAVETLEKMVAANPANADVQYWLGQAFIEWSKADKAKEVYRKALEVNGSSPILIVGMGHVELLEGKKNEARQRFEAAISLTKAKDVNVLNAIGKANIDLNADYDYGIEKLNLATTIKGFKEPDVYVNMGDIYRKKSDGGAAVKAYEKALEIDPKYAVAHYRIAKIYYTQGKDQEETFTNFFNKAIASDAKFAPAYYDLYVYFFSRDVYKSRGFFNQYKENADKGAALDYEEASLSYASGDFKDAIVKSDALIQQYGQNVDPRVFRLKGYSYNKLMDSINALQFLEQYFAKVNEDQVITDNWIVAAELSSKVPGKITEFDKYVRKALASDTSIKSKVATVRKAVDIFKKAGNQAKVAEWSMAVLNVAPTPTKTDLYNAGYEHYKLGQYLVADSLFDTYKAKYPDEVYGYLWSYRSLAAVDTSMKLGLAIPDAIKLVEIAELDKVKNKSIIVSTCGFLASYLTNEKKDYAGALGYIEKILAVDPANVDALKYREILQKAATKPGGKPSGG